MFSEVFHGRISSDLLSHCVIRIWRVCFEALFSVHFGARQVRGDANPEQGIHEGQKWYEAMNSTFVKHLPPLIMCSWFHSLLEPCDRISLRQPRASAMWIGFTKNKKLRTGLLASLLVARDATRSKGHRYERSDRTLRTVFVLRKLERSVKAAPFSPFAQHLRVGPQVCNTSPNEASPGRGHTPLAYMKQQEQHTPAG